SDYISSSELARIKELPDQVNGKLPLTITLASGRFLSSVLSHELYYILEIEKRELSNSNEESFISVYQDLKYVMSAVETAGTLKETCEIVIHELKKISGFDKIMIYRFDEAWNGDVIAERMEEGMDNYLGLKFPASDIPKQARELYKKAPYRLIPNADYEPVRLYPVINPVTNAFTDLSDSSIRSVAGVHLEYLKNMGVIASMSTRILVNGQLWGLIACHHRKAKYLSFEICSMFEILSNVISAKITSVLANDQFAYKTEMQSVYSSLVESIFKDEDLASTLNRYNNDLQTLLGADGVAIILNGHIEVYGTAPDRVEVEELVLWLQTRSTHGLFHHSNLVSAFEPAGVYADVASGLLVLPIQPDRGHFIIAFRPEAVQKVDWGGNPNQAITFEADGKKYHPRNSFKLWQQTVHQTAIPWNKEELEVAEQFRHFVVEYTLNKVYN
ncbi:MAG TPA: GAF domain-containing protein, partial [Flavisolibacter sp.]|nr:GAF domain-containing protein [Flavisolibacter sp.]